MHRFLSTATLNLRQPLFKFRYQDISLCPHGASFCRCIHLLFCVFGPKILYIARAYVSRRIFPDESTSNSQTYAVYIATRHSGAPEHYCYINQQSEDSFLSRILLLVVIITTTSTTAAVTIMVVISLLRGEHVYRTHCIEGGSTQCQP